MKLYRHKKLNLTPVQTKHCNQCPHHSHLGVLYTSISSEICNTKVTFDFPQFIKANSRIMPQVVPLLLSSTSLPIHCSLITVPPDTIQTELLTASFNEPQNKIQQSILVGISSKVSKGNDTEISIIEADLQ